MARRYPYDTAAIEARPNAAYLCFYRTLRRHRLQSASRADSKFGMIIAPWMSGWVNRVPTD
jgi:hypothetical protein